MGITREGKLRRELDTMTDAARNAENVARAMRAERDQARIETESIHDQLRENDRNCLNMMSEIGRGHQHVRRLFASIFHLNLELARKAGYIDRVKEMDAQSPESIIGPAEFIDRERDNLAGARSDKMVASVIDGMDPDILDQVLGRNDEVDFERG